MELTKDAEKLQKIIKYGENIGAQDDFFATFETPTPTPPSSNKTPNFEDEAAQLK